MTLTVVHAVISWWIILTVVWFGSRDAQWGLVWVYFWIADFPISMIHWGAMVMNSQCGALFDAIMDAVPLIRLVTPEWNLGIVEIALPSILFGVIGPLWYGLLPALLERGIRLIRR